MRNLTIEHDGVPLSGWDEKGKYAWHNFIARDEAGKDVGALCVCVTDYDDDQELGTGDGGSFDGTDEELESLREEATRLVAEHGGYEQGQSEDEDEE